MTTVVVEPGFTFVGCAPERNTRRNGWPRWEAHWTYANAAGKTIGGVREVLPGLTTGDTSKEDAEAWAVANVTPEWGPVRIRR